MSSTQFEQDVVKRILALEQAYAQSSTEEHVFGAEPGDLKPISYLPSAPAEFVGQSDDTVGNTQDGVSTDVPPGDNGDLLIWLIGARASSLPTIPVPAGWSSSHAIADGTSVLRVVYRGAGAEPAHYFATATPAGADNGMTGKILRYRGFDSVTPFAALDPGNWGSDATAEVNSVNMSRSDTTLIAAAVHGGSSFTPPAGMDEIADYATTTPVRTALAVGSQVFKATGATGTKTLTLDSAAPWVTIAVDLRRDPAPTYLPDGWLLCDGSLYNIEDYEELYDKIDTTWGGDGVTTFAVPNLTSKFLRGATTPGGTGGAATHSHGGVTAGDGATVANRTPGAGLSNTTAHTHTINSSSSLPPYVDAVWLIKT